jgi:hypothetical protein
MKIANSFVSSNPYWCALESEAKGEITLAMRPEYINKWGIHYLRSLYMAHSMQLRNNFKDVAVQYYGIQPEMEAIRIAINDVFNDLPAPKPSRASPTQPQLTSLATYNTASNGCFAGSCIVLATPDPFTIIPYPKPISELRVGEYVATNSQLRNFALVNHIAIMRNNTSFPVVKFPSGLIITPWHPIKLNGDAWQFPQNIVDKDPSLGDIIEYDQEVYNIVLDGADFIEINGITAITLGHQITDDPVASHPYFGSTDVVDDLDDMDKDEWGRVHLTPANVQRDPESNKIIRYVM